MLRRQQHQEIALVDAVKQVARFLVEQVAVDVGTAQQVDALLPSRLLGAHGFQLRLDIGDLPAGFEVGRHAALAVKGVPDEEAPHCAGEDVEGERNEDCGETRTNDHAGILAQ